MAFEWGGTFTRSQFENFRSYVLDQVQLIDARIAHLKAERARIGDLSFAYDSAGLPTNVANDDPPVTYIDKLFGAYEALGGNVELDLQVRSATQPVFRLPGDATRAAQLLSNGEVIPAQGLDDAESALAVQAIRGWVSKDLARRRDYLERKIRRAIDYAEQLTAEIVQLELLKGEPETEGSLAFYLNAVNTLAVNRNYMAITDDTGTPDPHGKFAKAPFAAFMPGPKGSTAVSYQRTLDGLVKPSQ
jgi:hypothetical protein